MTALRQQMIDAMTVRGFAPSTHESYLYAVTQLAAYYHRSPDKMGIEDIKNWFVYLVKNRHLSAATCRLYLNGIRFLYLQVLQDRAFDVAVPLPRYPQRIPELLTREEVRRIIAACGNRKHHSMLQCLYGCGLRVSELVAIRLKHIDSERRLLRIDQSKGNKDRLVPIPPSLIKILRDYWQQQRPHPTDWLFPRQCHLNQHLGISSIQRAYRQAKQAASVNKTGGIHSLRHAYATHQLAAGLPVHQLQQLLGHTSLKSTLRYVHWLPAQSLAQPKEIDLLAPR
jgi:integrase